ncbi:hypothetical protein BDZ91DRAFT_726243 [Kalaharituber pfeilii]|nr:hypothetical protein BDZ91DRAFT_726243 [Kalaharituber pfeilii]
MPRDPELFPADNYLTESKLDELCDWFSTAIHENAAPEEVLARVIQTVRQCYHGGNCGRESNYTPSESTVTTPAETLPPCSEPAYDNLQPCLTEAQASLAATQTSLAETQASLAEAQASLAEAQASLAEARTTVAVKQSLIDQLQEQLTTMNNKHEELIRTSEREKQESKHQSNALKERYERQLGTAHDPTPTYVAIKSATFNDRYVRMISDQGTAEVFTSIGGWEIFQLMRHGKGIVSFKSTWLNDAYLTMEACPNPAKEGWSRLGTVKCNTACGKNEQFRIHPAGNIGTVWLESVGVGKFLSVHEKELKVGVQPGKGTWEKFYLVIVR